MRPQTLALIVASTVTGLFLTAVGIVAIGQFMPPSAPQPAFQNQPQVAFQFNGVPVAPLAELDFPIEEPQFLPPAELPRVRAFVPASDYVLSGPHGHGNLAIYLIHGEDKIPGQKIMTLQEGLDQGLAVVHDTGATLRIDNRANVPLFIQSGDIVKGGNQDRTLPSDMLISARKSQVPMNALCVESGRSFPRGNELSASFQTSNEQLPGRTLRLAAIGNQQAQVWSNVQALQANLARNVGGSVQAPASATSLQLTLEHPRVQRAVQDYLADLANVANGKNDAIGYAVVINGNIQSADVYASSALFQKLWPKLLKASAVEAIAERQPGARPAPTARDVQAFLAAAEKGQPAAAPNGNRGMSVRLETARQLLIDTCDPAQDFAVLHRSVIAK